MKAAVVIAALSIGANLAGCGLFSMVPGWCGGEGSGGGQPPSGVTPQPLATADPRHLLCIAAENRSSVDMGLNELRDGQVLEGGLISACTGMQASEPGTTGRWSLQVGRTSAAGSIDRVLANFDASQFTGAPPYLIEVVINADFTATIAQRASLPLDSARSLC
jgi:hypothetical protein